MVGSPFELTKDPRANEAVINSFRPSYLLIHHIPVRMTTAGALPDAEIAGQIRPFLLAFGWITGAQSTPCIYPQQSCCYCSSSDATFREPRPYRRCVFRSIVHLARQSHSGNGGATRLRQLRLHARAYGSSLMAHTASLRRVRIAATQAHHSK